MSVLDFPKPKVLKVLAIGICRVEIWPAFLRTVFPDGLSVPAAANDDADSLERAASLGYPNTWMMSLHHELSHSLLAVAQGLDYSPVLRGVAIREAGGKKDAILSQEESDAEETRVMDFQYFVMRHELPLALGVWAEDHGIDLDAVAAELRSLTGTEKQVEG